MATFAMLPAELVQMIIQYLKDDRKSSRACSLVCRSWVRPTRPALFSRISLRFTAERCDKFLALVRDSPVATFFIREIIWRLRPSMFGNVSSDTERAFALSRCLLSLSEAQGVTHTIVVDLRSTNAEYILQILELAPKLAVHVDTVRWGCQDGLNEWGSNVAQSLASKLNHTKNLTLEQWGRYPFQPTLPTEKLVLLFPTTHVTKLKVSSVIFRSSAHFLQFVHAFIALEDLTCPSSGWTETSEEHENCVLGAPPLHRIDFRDSDVAEVVVGWLLAQSNALCLESLIVPSDMPHNINDLFNRCASTIRYLGLSSKSTGFIPQSNALTWIPVVVKSGAKSVIDLGLCTKLRRLDLYSNLITCSIAALDKVKHRTLRCMYISGRARKTDDWAALSAVLTRPCFLLVHTLTIKLYGADEEIQIQAKAALACLQHRPSYRLETV
jgi:hypothetical protein